MRRRALFLGCLVVSLAAASCRRRLEVSEPTYRETVTAFYTAVAAMQTSQDVLARRELERVTELVPGEPAGWANLGLLLMRQQELDAAAVKLAKAAELAPKSAAVQRLLALLESRKGRLPEAIVHWRRAADLDPKDLRAPYALALDIEREGGSDGAAEAQRVLELLLGRTENLAARLELARLAARRGDAAGLRKALAPLPEASRSWPAPAREQFGELQKAAADASGAATRVAFLKNVLLRAPEFRRALAAVSTPRSEIGEPLVTFLALRDPEPHAAPPDDTLAFKVEELDGLVPPERTGWVGPMWLSGEGTPVLVTASAGEVRLPGGGKALFPGGGSAPGPKGVVAADFNYDYRTDLLLVGAGGVKLLRQEEDGRFADVAGATKLPAAVLGAPAFGAWAADVDTDGDLDVVLAPVDGPPVVLRNNGDGTFAEQRPFAGISRLRGFAWGDLDGDGVPDAALLDAGGTVHVLLNFRGGVFREESLPTGTPKVVALAAAPTSGELSDVLGVVGDGAVMRLSLGEDRRNWETRTIARVPGLPAGTVPGLAGLLVEDLDNNGAVDLVVAGPTASRVLLGDGGGAFRLLPAPVDFSARASADLDGDGRLEILGITEGGRPARATSRGATAYRWQVLRPRSATATGDQRINSFGIGGEVELRTGLHLQKRTIDAPVVHFGLGDATRAEVVRILWPNGMIQSDFNTAADTAIAATQRLKGSCPWLFAWNGREMAFVTDLIWRSPLGLRINAQQTADVLTTEDWVKLRGDQLVPRDTFFDLRVTAELWETHFFDLLALRVVDHPEGTEVFVDERFAVPTPKLAVDVTGPLRELRAVRDDEGRDVSDVVRARDGRHLDFAGRGAYQGVTRDHYVELELPEDAPRRGPLWLVGQGWVHPTDSSINVAMSQGTHAPPRGLSLHVADAAGRFRRVRDRLGFPSGKDKTILVDLTDVFPAKGSRRLRLATNLEIFWDRLAWATGRPDVRVTPRSIDLASAELRYRGYSVTEQPDPASPERPRYVLAGTAPRWLDLEGYHTRFGDVRELLAQVDDRYVIMNAGDEMRLRFPEVPAPGAGLVRDFVLVGDGWVKDGDFNTTFSRTVLPLPTHASGRYDHAPRALEDDPVYRAHRRDFEEYHTRYVSPERARLALRDAAAGGTVKRYRRPFVIALFVALLATPAVMRRFGRRAAVAHDVDPRARYGFRLTESAKAAGIEARHEAPTLDSRLDHIMPQVSAMGAAVSVVDFDRDGHADLYVTNSREGSKNHLYHNRGDGTFEDVAERMDVADLNRPETGVSMGAVWGDYDNDGFEDLLLYRWGKPELFRNDGGRRFVRATDAAGLPAWANLNSALWLDFDRDGRLDFFLGGYYPEQVNLWKLTDTKMMPESFEYAKNGGRKFLYRNLGGGRFEEVSAKRGLVSRRWTLAAVAADLRGTGYPDLFLANDYGVSELFVNEGGRFREKGRETGVGYAPKSGMNASVGDVLNQGRFAVYVSNISEEGILIQGNNLWVPTESGKGLPKYENMATAMGVDLGGWSFGAQFGDLNNDGHMDIYLVNGYISASREETYWYDYSKIAGGHEVVISDARNWPPMGTRSLAGYQQKKVWINDGSGHFFDVAPMVGVGDRYDGRSVALADLGDRGMLDVLVANQRGPLLLYRNDVAPGRDWIGFDLEGGCRDDAPAEACSNRSAIGAQVTVYWNGGRQVQEVSGGSGFCAQNQRRLHFGLGSGALMEKAVVRWPSGKLQELVRPPLNQVLRLKEPT